MSSVITALKAALESERRESFKKAASKNPWKSTPTDSFMFKSGHEAATERLMTIVEKALEMAEFYNTRFVNNDFEIVPVNGAIGTETINVYGKKAREFLTTLADASGEIKKENE